MLVFLFLVLMVVAASIGLYWGYQRKQKRSIHGELLRVVMEFDDRVQELSGAEAQRWMDSCNASVTMDFIHGRPFPEFKWKIKYKGGHSGRGNRSSGK